MSCCEPSRNSSSLLVVDDDIILVVVDDEIPSNIKLVFPFLFIPTTLQPSEQKRSASNKLLPQISQMCETAFPDLGCGLSFRNKTLALFMTYVCTPSMFNTFSISETLTTS